MCLLFQRTCCYNHLPLCYRVFSWFLCVYDFRGLVCCNHLPLWYKVFSLSLCICYFRELVCYNHLPLWYKVFSLSLSQWLQRTDLPFHLVLRELCPQIFHPQHGIYKNITESNQEASKTQHSCEAAVSIYKHTSYHFTSNLVRIYIIGNHKNLIM